MRSLVAIVFALLGYVMERIRPNMGIVLLLAMIFTAIAFPFDEDKKAA